MENNLIKIENNQIKIEKNNIKMENINTHKCYRHEGSHSDQLNKESLLLNSKISNLDTQTANNISKLWAIYMDLPWKHKTLALDGILHHCCFPQLSYLSDTLVTLTKVDFVAKLPTDLAYKVLHYLDATSLCRTSQVSKTWNTLCDNDVLWKRMCYQHIDRICTTCGWGLPLMHAQKRKDTEVQNTPNKRFKCSPDNQSIEPLPSHSKESTKCFNIAPLKPIPIEKPTKNQIVRPWKQVFAERSVVARNWRKPSFSTKNLIGHTDAVMGIYFDDAKSLLITASFDTTLRAWNVETGLCIGILKGHTKCVRGVQFDDSKIVSCSMDKTIRIWDLKTFNCVRVIEGHTEGVVCVHFIDRILASGSVDGIIRVWNLEAGCSFTLVGHRDWVNKVRVLPGKKELLSCSDDNKMILWDIETRTPIRVFSGHVGPIQTLALLKPRHTPGQQHIRQIVTGSLDNTIKIWDFHTGRVIKTLFGHTEGVWSVDADLIRIVSGSQDKTVKIWNIESGQCLYTIESHAGSVPSLWLSDTKLISGDDTGIVTVRDFLKA
ncbi:WD40-repeat-containing domain protein [Globomyces pollinis-pini]|nr:WD40-repeat-containing domain protein [Globomyces pollinis-pini]